MNNTWRNLMEDIKNDKSSDTLDNLLTQLRTDVTPKAKEARKANKQTEKSFDSLVNTYCIPDEKSTAAFEYPRLAEIYKTYNLLSKDAQDIYKDSFYNLLKDIDDAAWEGKDLSSSKEVLNFADQLRTVHDEEKEQMQAAGNKTPDVINAFKNKQTLKTKASGYVADAIFLLYNGLNPVLLDRIPLWDEETSKMVKLVGIDKKNNKFFTNNDIDLDLLSTTDTENMPDYVTYPESDKMILISYEIRRKDHDEYKYNDTFIKEQGEKIELTVEEFINRIYNLPINQEAVERAAKKHPLTDKEIVINGLKAEELGANKEKFDSKMQALDAMGDSKELIDGLEKARENHRSKILNTFAKKKQEGFTNEDLAFILDEWEKYLCWEEDNRILVVVENKLKEQEDKERLDTFENMKKTWFKSNLTGQSLNDAVKSWYKGKLESINEARFSSSQNKPQRITHPGEVAEYMELLGIPPKHRIISITKPELKDKENNVIAPAKEFTIYGFEDADKVRELLALDDKLNEYRKIENKLRSYIASPKAKVNFHRFEKLKDEYEAAKEANKADLATFDRLMKTATILVKECDSNGVPTKKLPYPMSLSTIRELLKLPQNSGKEFSSDKNELLKTYDTHNPFKNKNENHFKHINLTPDMLKDLISSAKQHYENEVPQGFTIPHGLTADTYENYWGTTVLLNTLAASGANAFLPGRSGFRAKRDKYGKVVGYVGVTPISPRSRMNGFPGKSITKMV